MLRARGFFSTNWRFASSVGFDGSSVGAASERFGNSTFPFLITRTVSQKFDFQGTNDQPVRIGCSKDRPQYTFNGAIDEVAVFRRALSLDEIKQVMNGDLLAVSPKDRLATTWGSLKAHQ
ncbi:hypothetical protein IH992_18585 [Candidatus Poribacteria bacterium]|nr:hypothetical protein [Candidatus Poribacteria bacterium]